MNQKKHLIGERKLSLANDKNKEIWVKVYAPIEEDGDYTCEYSYEGISEEIKQKKAIGVDGLQAVMLAFQRIGAELEYYNKTLFSNHLHWLDESVKDMDHFGFLTPLNGNHK